MLMEEPINPKSVVDLTLEIAEQNCVYGLNSAIMILNPIFASHNLIEQLKKRELE